MKLVAAGLFATALSALAMPAWEPAATAPDDPACAQADALWALDYKKTALKAYGRLAPTKSCARTRLKEIKDEADAAVTAADKAKETAHSKVDGAASDPLLDQVRALRAAGLDDEATAKLKVWAERYPGANPPRNLRPASRNADRWDRILADYAPRGRSLAEAAAVALAALAFVLLLWRLVGFRPRWLRCRVLRTVRIEVPAQQEALSTALADHLREFKKTGAGGNAKFVGPSEGDFELPANLVTAFAPAGLITSLLNLLRKVWPMRVASVALHPADPQRGLGVTVTVRGGPRAAITVWETDFDLLPPKASDKGEDWRLQRLMLPVAAWLAYALDQAKPPTRPLGSTNWRSYAHFAVGAVFQRQGEHEAADKQYRLALDRCSRNRGARLNLAALSLAVDPPRPGTSQLVDLPDDPELLLARLSRWPDEGPEAPLLWRARYVRAVGRVYRGWPKSAADDLEDLADLLDEKAGDPDTEMLRQRLRRLREIFLASVTLERDKAAASSAGPKATAWESAAGYYNLACYWARRLRFEPNKHRHRDHAELALLYLTHALRHASDETKAAARKDPALQTLAERSAFTALTRRTPAAAVAA